MKARLSFSSLLFTGLVVYFSWRMYQIVLPYTSGAWDVDFLLTKQMIIHLDHYRFAFYGHIYSSLMVLLSGALLFSKQVLRLWPKIHRMTGKVYVGLVLGISAPTALVMGFYANGGWGAALSFIILAPLWWYTSWMGYSTIRKKKVQAHRYWMLRSYALTFSAVTLRVGQMLLGYFWVLDPEFQYILVSWGSWMLNLVLVELYIYYEKNRAYHRYTRHLQAHNQKLALYDS